MYIYIYICIYNTYIYTHYVIPMHPADCRSRHNNPMYLRQAVNNNGCGFSHSEGRHKYLAVYKHDGQQLCIYIYISMYTYTYIYIDVCCCKRTNTHDKQADTPSEDYALLTQCLL